MTAHIASCERCMARLAAHRRERAVFAMPLRRVRRRARWPIWVAAAAAAAGLWLVVSPDRREPVDGRTKGRPTIGFYVKHDGVVRRGGAGEIVFPDDAINFTASTDHPTFLAIISIDSAHTVSVYYPDGPTAAAVQAGQDQLLPLSVVLDGVLGTERLHGVFCDGPIRVEQVETALARGSALPGGCVMDTVAIEKRRTP